MPVLPLCRGLLRLKKSQRSSKTQQFDEITPVSKGNVAAIRGNNPKLRDKSVRRRGNLSTYGGNSAQGEGQMASNKGDNPKYRGKFRLV